MTHKNWPDAEHDCNTRGGHLVSIGSMSEQNFIHNALRVSVREMGCRCFSSHPYANSVMAKSIPHHCIVMSDKLHAMFDATG